MVATAIYSVTMVLWKETAFTLLQSHGKALDKTDSRPAFSVTYIAETRGL